MEQNITEELKINPHELPKWLSQFWNRLDYNNVVAGINDDDCAVISCGEKQIVISTDYLNSSPIAIELGICSFADLGRLVVAANLSDLCGTGAKPIAFLLAVMLDKDITTEKNFKDLLSGVKKELSKYKIPLIGGDTKLGKSNCFCGIILGKKRKKTSLFLKSKAQIGDLIWVSGKIGSVAAAIDGLSNDSMSESWNKWAKSKIIKPQIPLKQSASISKIKGIKAGTDLSDGLISDLYSICESSDVGAVIESSKIPFAKKVKDIAHKRNIDPWKYALTIGGDFQFIITASPKLDISNYGFFNIGYITNKKKVELKLNEKYFLLPNLGHNDYQKVNFKNEVATILSKLNFIND